MAKWYWDQHGSTLSVMTQESDRALPCCTGPFETEADALRDALKEYSETWRLYNTAILDAHRRLLKLTSGTSSPRIASRTATKARNCNS